MYNDSTNVQKVASFICQLQVEVVIATVTGNFKIHTFTGPGTFTVSVRIKCASSNVVDYLVIAGGGGGGSVVVLVVEVVQVDLEMSKVPATSGCWTANDPLAACRIFTQFQLIE